MKEFVQLIQNEWVTISSAPVTFVLLLIIAFGVAFFVTNWRYEGIVDSLKERIESFKERLEAKDDQLMEYRERLHLIPAAESTYSRFTNVELKQKSLDVVSQIRDFLKNRNEKLNDNLFSGRRANLQSMSEEDRQKLWHQETNASMRAYRLLNADYNRDFRVDTILLRDELLSRLPPNAKNEKEYRTYERPTNPIGISIVADDLERLAKSLPSKGGA